MALVNAFGDIALDATVQAVLDKLGSGIKQLDDLRITGSVDTSYSWTLQYVEPSTAGSGYVVGDTITLSGGTYTTAAVVTVTEIDGSGGVVAATVTTIGAYTATQTSLSQGSTSGSGTGAVFTTTCAQYVALVADTSGYNYAVFQFISKAGGATTVQGSLDDGKTWVNLVWYFNGTPVSGSTGSASTATRNEIFTPWSKIRIVNSTNCSLVLALRSVSGVTNTVVQGSNTGSNQIWYVRQLISNYGGIGHTNGGGGKVTIVSTAGTNITQIGTAARRIHSLNLFNNAATPAYLKIFNTSSTPTLGTDTPVAVYVIPAGGQLSLESDIGLEFTEYPNKLHLALTLNPALLDNTAIGADEVIGTVVWN